MAKKVYEVVVCDNDGNKIDDLYFNSLKAARSFKPQTGHKTCVCEFPLFSYKDV